MSNPKQSAAFIGRGKMLHDCLLRTVKAGNLHVPLVVTQQTDDLASRKLAGLCARHDIMVVDTPDPNCQESLDRLREAAPEALFNVDSFSILKKPLLDIPPRGVVNFHNGPLPKYAGVNIPTWVIWNAETTHGVTWHFVDEGIDTGDVITQAHFPVAARETAISLTVKCIIEGIKLFDTVLAEVFSDRPARCRQSGPRSQYRRRDIPNLGDIEFAWPMEQINRLIRALTFHPAPNLLVPPGLRLGNDRIGLGDVEVIPDMTADCAPGTVLAIRPDRMDIGLSGGRMEVRSLIDAEGVTLSITEGVARYRLAPATRLG